MLLEEHGGDGLGGVEARLSAKRRRLDLTGHGGQIPVHEESNGE